MPIDIDEVAIGRCYATANNQHRKVTAIDGETVTYESWGGNVGNHQAPRSLTKVNIAKFAEDVDKTIPCPPV